MDVDTPSAESNAGGSGTDAPVANNANESAPTADKFEDGEKDDDKMAVDPLPSKLVS